MTGCGGAKIERQRAELEKLHTEAGRLLGKAKEAADAAEACEARRAECDGRLTEANGKLAAAQARTDSLVKSNQDLSKSLESNQGELSKKVRELIGEKDQLSQRLAEIQKERAVAERLKTKAATAYLDVKRRYDAAAAELEEGKAEKARAQAQRRERVGRAMEDKGSLADAVLKELQAESAQLAQDAATVALTLQEPLLFSAGEAKLTEAGAALLDRVGAALGALGPRLVRVEAHSDNAPFKRELFGGYAGHWELTAARATVVARYLHEHAGLDPKRLSAAGFGEFRPAGPNDSAEGRAANRRVLIVVDPI